MAGEIAWQLGFSVTVYEADWVNHGKSAGPRRNQLMLDRHPEIERAFAFVVPVGNKITPGTSDMLSRLLGKGIPYTVISEKR